VKTYRRAFRYKQTSGEKLLCSFALLGSRLVHGLGHFLQSRFAECTRFRRIHGDGA
jgi:hypothetical protein